MMSDTRMQRGEQWLKELLQLSGFSVEIKVDKEESSLGEKDPLSLNSYWLKIEESNLNETQIQNLIGRDGKVLDAIQYLSNSILNLNQETEEQASYTVELNGYRVQRLAEIRNMIDEVIDRVRTTGREVEVKSLSSAERRQVHTLLKGFEDLESFSQGKEPHRHLVVRPFSW
ncbi:single-stranded nucleic acid binding R3H domain-containing protein [Calothrix parasitica NIES-267]|uniref:Single-stranded nucleic acid binding R3H domain-containing protein n=1 Tax=Calothrix parasitica NIES-267 TaxID=1973488 RepID=A0A1Z4LZS2_9CYAN|nr:single-stranded nucleic acid binding R3H domain-containing protein [Calothrix parasitica NIES-267]